MGLMDNINAGLQNGMQSPLFNLGTGLIAGAQPFANPGQQLQASAAATQAEQQRQQQLYMQNLQLQMLQQQWPYMKNLFGQLGGLMGSPQSKKGKTAQAPSAVPSAPVVGGFSPLPTAGASAPPPAASPAPSGALPGGGLMGDPSALERFGIMASMFPMTQPMGKAAQTAAEFEAQNSPQIQAQLAAAKSAVNQDVTLLRAAQANAAPPSILQGLQTKLQTDLGQLHIGSMSGILTRQLGDGSWTTTDPRTGLATNTVTGSRLMPGAASAQQAMAAAHAQGEAAGEVEKVWNPQTQSWEYVPRSAITGGAGQAAAGPNGQREITPFQAAPGPATDAMLEGNAKQAIETNKEYQTQSEAGVTMLSQVQELRNAAAEMGTGKFEPARQEGLNVLSSLGFITPAQSKALGAAQAGTKIAIQLQAAATKTLGSREAAQIFQWMGKSQLNLTLSPQGFEQIAAYTEGMAHYQQARAQVAQQYANANNWQGVNSTRDTFINKSNPMFYIVASASPAVQAQIVRSMGPRSGAFMKAWKNAVRAGYAPTPQAYWGQHQ